MNFLMIFWEVIQYTILGLGFLFFSGSFLTTIFYRKKIIEKYNVPSWIFSFVVMLAITITFFISLAFKVR